MLRRSEERCRAARILLDKRLYDACVVAYYYGVLQRMMYALNEDSRRPLSYDSQVPINEDIHKKIFTEIRNRITNTREEKAFKEQFEELFNYRKKADYLPDSITQEECAACRTLFDGLMARLNRCFPLRG